MTIREYHLDSKHTDTAAGNMNNTTGSMSYNMRRAVTPQDLKIKAT